MTDDPSADDLTEEIKALQAERDELAAEAARQAELEAGRRAAEDLAAAQAAEQADAETLARKAMEIAADICVFTNNNFVVETLDE